MEEEIVLDAGHALDPDPAVVEEGASDGDVEADLRPEEAVLGPLLDGVDLTGVDGAPVQEPLQDGGRISARRSAVQLQLVVQLVRGQAAADDRALLGQL